MVEYGYVRTNSVTLHVAQAGPPEGQPVVLLHGFPEFWYGWREQIPALAEAGFRVWAPDQRGYNLSEKPPGVRSYELDALARDVVGLMDAAGVERAFVAGHDWGAMVAWWLGLHYPDRLEKLAILNVPHPAVFLPFLSSHPAQLLKSWYMFFFQVPYLPELALRKTGRRALRDTSKPGVFGEEDLEKYQKAWDRPGAMTAMINWYRAAARRGGGRSVEDPTVRVPTLMIWGEEDAFLDRRMAEPSIEFCEEGRLVKLPGISHWVQHEAAGRVNRLLVEHFR
ncbi:MAG: alpha/beta fold hydrolase [Rubrobacteraceae bacterium]